MTDSDLLSAVTADATAKALADAGNDSGCAAYFAAADPANTPLAVPVVPRDQFLLSLTPAYLALASLDAAGDAASVAKGKKWDRILAVIMAADSVTVNPGLLALAVADGILTQSQADAAWHRTGTRAEALWGVGSVVTAADVSRVYAANRPGGRVS